LLCFLQQGQLGVFPIKNKKNRVCIALVLEVISIFGATYSTWAKILRVGCTIKKKKFPQLFEYFRGIKKGYQILVSINLRKKINMTNNYCV